MMRTIALGFVFAWFFLGGLAHFVFTADEIRIVPPWVPMPQMAVWVTGVLELIGAAGLLLSRTRRLAGCGLIGLTIAVTPANVYMWQNAEAFPAVPEWVLIARLVFQILLIVLIGWAAGVRAHYEGRY